MLIYNNFLTILLILVKKCDRKLLILKVNGNFDFLEKIKKSIF